MGTCTKRIPKNLKIDFAHCGRQYNSIANIPTTTKICTKYSKTKKMKDYHSSPWFYNIIKLMNKYENVYMDVSFSGSSPNFYIRMNNFLNNEEYKEKKRFIS